MENKRYQWRNVENEASTSCYKSTEMKSWSRDLLGNGLQSIWNKHIFLKHEEFVMSLDQCLPVSYLHYI